MFQGQQYGSRDHHPYLRLHHIEVREIFPDREVVNEVVGFKSLWLLKRFNHFTVIKSKHPKRKVLTASLAVKTNLITFTPGSSERETCRNLGDGLEALLY